MHKMNEELYTQNQWNRVHAQMLQRIVVALEKLARIDSARDERVIDVNA